MLILRSFPSRDKCVLLEPGLVRFPGIESGSLEGLCLADPVVLPPNLAITRDGEVSRIGESLSQMQNDLGKSFSCNLIRKPNNGKR